MPCLLVGISDYSPMKYTVASFQSAKFASFARSTISNLGLVNQARTSAIYSTLMTSIIKVFLGCRVIPSVLKTANN